MSKFNVSFKHRIAMLRNYLIIASRVIWNNKLFSLINIFGLAIGMAAAIVLFQYVKFEQSYDSFHELGNQIYRSNIYVKAGVNEINLPANNPGLGPLLKEKIPEVLDYARIRIHSDSRNVCLITWLDETGVLHKYDEDQEKMILLGN